MSHIYLAHPIDNVGPMAHIELAAQIDSITELLTRDGYTVFTPCKAWLVGQAAKPSAGVQRTNLAAIEHAAWVLCVWPDGLHSVGCGIEIGWAASRGVPVVVLTNSSGWALAGTPGVQVVHNADEARAVIQLGPPTKTETARVEGPGELPTRGHWDDAGFDLHYYGEEPITIEPGQQSDIPAGVAVEWPNLMWGLLVGRSSTFRKGLVVNPAIIDAGFRGRLFACVINTTDKPVTIEPGHRVAQIVPMATMSVGVEMERGRLTPSERGSAGWGSTGE